MSIWLRRGESAHRWDGHRLFGRPPVLAPPDWALAERIWESIGAVPREEPEVTPQNWLEVLVDAVPDGIERVVLVVPDATRVGSWRRVLPSLLRGLDRKLSASVERTLLVATGVHSAVAPQALRRHLGLDDDAPRTDLSADGSPTTPWALVQNSREDFREHRVVGQTARGTPVRLHPAYLDADWRITLGEVSYHYFAGYGGGPKLVFPGLADPEGAAHNHRLAVEAILAPGARSETEMSEAPWPWRTQPLACAGELAGNPVQLDLVDAASSAPAHWNLTVGFVPPEQVDPAMPRAFPLVVEQGPDLDAWRAAIRRHEALHRVACTARPRLLIADGGGAPRDDTLLQAQKSLQHAARFVEPRGRILLVVELGGGLGSEMLEAYVRDRDAVRLRLASADRGLGFHLQTLTALLEVTRGVEVGLWSNLPPEQSTALGFIPLDNAEEARDFCLRAGSEPTWGFLPRAERFLPARGWLGGGA